MWTDSGGFVHTASGVLGKTAPVPIQRLTGPDGSDTSGFVVVDLDGAEGADGLVRCAKKILLGRSTDDGPLPHLLLGPARGATQWRQRRDQRRGARTGNAGITAFVEGVAPRVAAGELSLDPGKGLGPADLEGLAAADTRGTLRDEPVGRVRSKTTWVALGCVTAAATVLDGLDGRSVSIEGAGSAGPALLELLSQAGARVVAVGTTSGSVVDAGGLDAAALAATWAEQGEALPSAIGSELPVDAWSDSPPTSCSSDPGWAWSTTSWPSAWRRRSWSQSVWLRSRPRDWRSPPRGGTTVLADFLTLSGPLQAWFADGTADAAAVVERVRDRTESLTRTSWATPTGRIWVRAQRPRTSSVHGRTSCPSAALWRDRRERSPTTTAPRTASGHCVADAHLGDGPTPPRRSRPTGAAARPGVRPEMEPRFGQHRAVVVVQGRTHHRRAVRSRLDATNDTPSPGRSPKSVTHAAIGTLVAAGRLDPTAPLRTREWADPSDPRSGITLLDLLGMRSGLRFVEDYVDDGRSDCLAMLFGEGADDVAAYAATRPARAPRGRALQLQQRHDQHRRATPDRRARAAG